jgi:hypothetical protein
MFKFLSVEDMICQSIISVANPELRKRLANAILLVGGGVKFKGMIDFLEDRLIDKLTTLDNEIDRVEIIHYPTVDSKTITWIGGSILPKLESSKDLWITRERWLSELEKVPAEEREKEVLNTERQGDDNESKKEFDTAQKEKNEKTKKKDRHLDGGPKVFREKTPFIYP